MIRAGERHVIDTTCAWSTIVYLIVLWAFGSAPRAQEARRSVWDGVYTAEQALRGEALYALECASCHSTAGVGGEMAPPLSGGEFTANWNGLTVGDLFERIRVTMPDDRKRLSRDQNTDLVAYMLSLNRFPAGKTALDRETEILKQIRVEARKPY